MVLHNMPVVLLGMVAHAVTDRVQLLLVLVVEDASDVHVCAHAFADLDFSLECLIGGTNYL